MRIFRKESGFDLYNNIVLLIIAIACVYPFIYVLFVAMSDGALLARGEISFFPKKTSIEAFIYILSNPDFNIVKGLLNSSYYSWLGTACSVIITYVTAYVLSRERFKHRKWIMFLFIITWVFEAGIIPQYIIYSKLGYVDNPLVMIIPGAISVQFMLICRSFLQGVPKEMEEAAFIDGANDISILLRIFVPLSSVVFATLSIFYAVNIWNQYLLPQIYLKSRNLHTIQQVLKSVVITDANSGTTFRNVIQNNITLNQQNLKAAAIFITMLPIVIVYPFVFKYFRKGILIGAIKG